MYKDKLLKLADFLENNVEPEWFDMDIWASSGFPQKECGSAACALGWATVIFPDEVKLVKLDYSYAKYNVVHKSDVYNFDAGAQLFGISLTDSEYLFYDKLYFDDSKDSVVQRIRDFANGKTRVGAPS